MDNVEIKQIKHKTELRKAARFIKETYKFHSELVPHLMQNSVGTIQQIVSSFSLTGKAVLGIYKDNQLIGILVYSEYPTYINVDEIYISSEFRHQGIGTYALAYIASLAKSKGKPHLRLAVANKNINAKSLYEQLGFKTEILIMSLDC